ncbi:unnamed protein product, partial [Didymodactylos carnosus]
MAKATTSGTNIERFVDVCNEPRKKLLPIEGYEKKCLLTLEEAVKPISHLVDDLSSIVWIAKENCEAPADNLSQDESAAIHLYTIEWSPDNRSFYSVFNQTLREEDRHKLIPWFSYLKLFLTALHKLPSEKRVVWHGVKSDLSQQYKKGTKHVWWGVSSCTETLAVTDSFLGKNGTRTLFSIECYDGKVINEHSYYQSENEILLMPATYLEVVDQSNPADGLYIVHLKQKSPPCILLASPVFAEEGSSTKWKEAWKLPRQIDDGIEKSAIGVVPMENVNVEYKIKPSQ